MTAAPIAITGATGAIGGAVARHLADQGHDIRLVVRDADRAPRLPGAAIAVATYEDPASLRVAFDGAHALLFVSGEESRTRVEAHRNVAEAAAANGVEHVVYTSFQGASAESTFLLARDHAATESILAEVGLTTTSLRNGLYADILIHLADDDGVIRGPAGEGRVAAVARRDVADVAATALVDRALAGQTLTLTGPEALTLTEVAATLSRVTGRSVRYVPETLAAGRRWRAAGGAPDWLVEAWLSTYTAIAAGELAEVSGDVEAVLGRPPTDLATVVAAAS